MNTSARQQRGVSFFGFIWIAAGLIFVAIVGMKMVPAYVHSAQIGSILKTIATDPAMQTGTIKDIKESYTKRASINYITDITAEDLDISKEGNILSLSANYAVKIPVAGNVTLLIEFHPSSF